MNRTYLTRAIRELAGVYGYTIHTDTDDRTPREILDTDLYFIDRIGLASHLSPTRSNGLLAMVKQIRDYATAYNLLDKEQ